MNVFYSDIEQEIVEHLIPVFQGGAVDVFQLPQVQAEFQRPFGAGRVTVAYKSSDFGDVRNTFDITQDEMIQIELVVQSRTLRGNTGLHSITEAVKRRLIGFRPTDCSKMYLVKNGFTEHNNETALWAYSMVFQSRYTIVEDTEYNTETPLNTVTFQYNDEFPEIPPIPFPGTFPNPPVIAYKGDIAYWDGEVWRRLSPGEAGFVLATMGEGEVPEWVSPQSGPQGEPGTDGQDGADGASAYEIAVSNGFEGTEQEWLESLRGADGQDGLNGQDGQNGQDGSDGLSAYQVALANGFSGTEPEWLLSLKGESGQDGADGLDGQAGADGKSAYEVAVQNGFVGTEPEWLLSLKGDQGDQGDQGEQGEQGEPGPISVQTRKHSYEAPYSYCGSALNGSSESSSAWTIKRIEYNVSGIPVTMVATGAWTNRTNLIYT